MKLPRRCKTAPLAAAVMLVLAAPLARSVPGVGNGLIDALHGDDLQSGQRLCAGGAARNGRMNRRF